MRHRPWLFPLVLLLFVALVPAAYSQSAKLKEIHAEGMKTFTEEQVASLSGLSVGSQVGRKELQDGANALLHSGLFGKVTYKFDTHNDSVSITFHVEENPRLPATYDNFPWFGDSELTDAIRKDLPFFDGTLPEDGNVVELAGNSLTAFLAG